MDIPLSSDALDLSFHPSDTTNLVAVGLISGKIQLINYDDYAVQPSSSRTPIPPSKKVRRDAQQGSGVDDRDRAKLYRKIWVSRPSKKSCRGLHFCPRGDRIYSISKDKSLFATDLHSGKVVDSWVGVHDAAPSRVLPIDETMVVTGDDDGVVRLWDPRKAGGVGAKPVRSWDHHFDWITDMVYLEDLPVPKPNKKAGQGRKSKTQLKKARKKARQAALLKQSNADNADHDSEEEDSAGSDSDVQGASSEPARSRLIVTSGDGSLSSIDLRSSGPTSFELSEDQEDELLSITSIRSSSKLVVGTQLGILSLWTPSRGLLDHVDRVPGHPASVDTLVTLDSETVLTGSSDGLVRVVQILPSKLLGVIASHDGLPVERMKRKGNVLGSIGHSNAVKFTDLTPLLEDDDQEHDNDDQESALGIVGLGAEESDEDEDEDEDDNEQDDDFAGLQNLDEPEQDSDQVENDDEDKDEDEDDEEMESTRERTPAKRQKDAKAKAGFFSDLFDPTR